MIDQNDWTRDIAAPSDAQLNATYDDIAARLDQTEDTGAWRAEFARWDEARRSWKSWANLTRLQYSQDTRCEAYRQAQAELDRRTPAVTALDTAMKRRFLRSGTRRALEDELGLQAFALWDADIVTYDDAIADGLVRESELTRAYTELVASTTVPFESKERTLATLAPFLQDSNRERRHAAERVRWSAYAQRGERFDAIFDDLVRLRDTMARTLGCKDFIELGYRRMRRIDYGIVDVARFRDEVARVVVPFAHDLVRRCGAGAGLERVYFWDEAVLGVDRHVAPLGDRAWILARTREALAAIDPALGTFVEMLLDRDLLDVEHRPGKALGAYCTMFPTRRVPFVFANFNGTRGDVRTLMHELGHAFQGWQSRDKVAVDYLVPTFESAEIHSMSLEYLSWPEMERFFGDGVAAYRREHLFDALVFLPYAVAVDHFQHLVYAHPNASSLERHAMWQEMERRYLPWREYGDLAYPAAGALWQERRHIFVAPFYYVDYALALCCALQFWGRAARERDATLQAYVALCGRGGEAPFRELVGSAGLRSPFEVGVLEDIVTAVGATFS